MSSAEPLGWWTHGGTKRVTAWRRHTSTSLFSCILAIHLYHFTVQQLYLSIIKWSNSKLPEFCKLVIAKYQAQEEGCGNFWFTASGSSEAQVNTLALGVASVGEATLWDWALSLWGLMPSPEEQLQNWVKLQDTQLVSENWWAWGKTLTYWVARSTSRIKLLFCFFFPSQ